LEGYAGRNRRNGVGFARKVRENARPPSRFSSEIGTKADAKQQKQGFRARARRFMVALERRKALKGCARLVNLE
jgi:hypothetical protein